MKYMLDTNICIYIIKQKPKEVFEKFKDYGHDDICISCITLSELEYGVAKSNGSYQNKIALAGFLAPLDILAYTDTAACEFGKIRADLERKGKVIGAYDMLIAAHAKSKGLILATNNVSEFSRVEGLKLENWVSGS